MIYSNSYGELVPEIEDRSLASPECVVTTSLVILKSKYEFLWEENSSYFWFDVS